MWTKRREGKGVWGVGWRVGEGEVEKARPDEDVLLKERRQDLGWSSSGSTVELGLKAREEEPEAGGGEGTGMSSSHLVSFSRAPTRARQPSRSALGARRAAEDLVCSLRACAR